MGGLEGRTDNVTITGVAQELYVTSATRVAVTCFMMNIKKICELLGYPLDDTVRTVMRNEGVHYFVDMTEENIEKNGGSVSKKEGVIGGSFIGINHVMMVITVVVADAESCVSCMGWLL